MGLRSSDWQRLTAPRAGRVTDIAVAAGSQVAEGANIMTIEALE